MKVMSVVEVISDVNEQMTATVNIANAVICSQSLYDGNEMLITGDPNYDPSMEENSSSSDEQSIEMQNSSTLAEILSEGTLTKVMIKFIFTRNA